MEFLYKVLNDASTVKPDETVHTYSTFLSMYARIEYIYTHTEALARPHTYASYSKRKSEFLCLGKQRVLKRHSLHRVQSGV